MFKKLCIIVANSSASLIAKSSALLVADYTAACCSPGMRRRVSCRRKLVNFILNQFTAARA
jgi:hypothetical protein